MKKKEPEITRRNVVSIRLNPAEGEGMARAAARSNRTVGEWLREVARAAIEASDKAAERTAGR